jgi:ATP-dependent Clp protease ATP-binding subunit ClpA
VPTFSPSLEKALHQALTFANERHHEYATLEHLLLALIDDADAAAVMGACNVDLVALRKTLVEYVDNELSNLSPVTMRTPSRRPASSASSSAR